MPLQVDEPRTIYYFRSQKRPTWIQLTIDAASSLLMLPADCYRSHGHTQIVGLSIYADKRILDKLPPLDA